MTRSDGKSHVSLSVLLSDNRNCIRVMQSRRKLHKDGRDIPRFPKRATSRIRANIHATYDEASLRLTYFCLFFLYLAIYSRIRVIMTLRWRRHTMVKIIFVEKWNLFARTRSIGIKRIVRRNLFSPSFNFAAGESRSFFESEFRENRIWFHGRISDVYDDGCTLMIASRRKLQRGDRTCFL